MNQDSIGALVQTCLYHMKSVEERLQWSRVDFKGSDKQKFNLAILKVKSAIDDIAGMTKNTELILKIKKELDKSDIVYFTTLTELLAPLPEYELSKITDLIEDYLNKKQHDQERLLSVCEE